MTSKLKMQLKKIILEIKNPKEPDSEFLEFDIPEGIRIENGNI